MCCYLGQCATNNTCTWGNYSSFFALATLSSWIGISSYTFVLLRSIDSKNKGPGEAGRAAFGRSGAIFCLQNFLEASACVFLTLANVYLPCVVTLSNESYGHALKIVGMLIPLTMGLGAVCSLLKVDPLDPPHSVLSQLWRTVDQKGGSGIQLQGGADGLLGAAEPPRGEPYYDQILREESLQCITQGIVASIVAAQADGSTIEMQYEGSTDAPLAEDHDSRTALSSLTSVGEMKPTRQRKCGGRAGGQGWIGQLTG